MVTMNLRALIIWPRANEAEMAPVIMLLAWEFGMNVRSRRDFSINHICSVNLFI